MLSRLPIHKDFLNRLFVSPAFDTMKEPFPVHDSTGDVIADLPDYIDDSYRVGAVTSKGVAFLALHLDKARFTGVDQFSIKPQQITRCLHTGMVTAWFTLDKPVSVNRASRVARVMGVENIAALHVIPAPDHHALIHYDDDAVCGIEALEAAFCMGLPHRQGEYYGDAVILNQYNEADYGQDITVTLGANRESKNWKPVTMPVGIFIAMLARHEEGAKDGKSFVIADMVPGQRLKNAVKECYGIGLDIDTGVPAAEIDAAMLKLGHLAIRMTSHSNGKTETEFKKDKIQKFIVQNGAGRELEDDETIRWFLRESEQWHPAVVDKAYYDRTDHNKNGIMAVIKHPSIDKNRVVFPLLKPFIVDKEGITQKEALDKWSKIPAAMAAMLGLPLDTSCTDASRLFYAPRHPKGGKFSASLVGGPLFDWRTLPLENPFEEALTDSSTSSKSKSVTPEGKELGKWSVRRAHGFQIADVVQEYASDRIRGHGTNGFDIECPFDENHSNAGDTEDRACFVVNAASGPSEFYTISCRHESCRDKTNNDMLGKMMKDGWFARTVLDDEQFNAILEGTGAPSPLIEPSADVDSMVDGLSKDSGHDVVQSTLRAIAQVTDLIRRAQLVYKVKFKTSIKMAVLEASIKAALHGQSSFPAQSIDGRGRTVLQYHGDFDEDEAVNAIHSAMVRFNGTTLPANMGENFPRFTCMMSALMVGREFDKDVTIEQAAPSKYTSELANILILEPVGEQGPKPRKHIAHDVAKIACDNAWQAVPQTPEIISCPVFSPSGQLITENGWHLLGPAHQPEFNIFLRSNTAFPHVPSAPTRAELTEAVHLIRNDLLAEFPFCDFIDGGLDTREYSEANAIAMLLTPFMRRMIPG